MTDCIICMGACDCEENPSYFNKDFLERIRPSIEEGLTLMLQHEKQMGRL